jgi:methylated-DNA-[protein]-cysteine S-methyltransferase
MSRPSDTFVIDHVPSPIGPLTLVTDARERLRVLWFDGDADQVRGRLGLRGASLVPGAAPASVRDRLAAYFEGDLGALEAIPVELEGTPFQRDVWSALRRIPVGRTTSYGQLAAAIGRPSAVRAVGLANGANPVGIVVPCHRVIGADSSLTGYAGGLERKRWLLEHEGASFGDRRRAAEERQPELPFRGRPAGGAAKGLTA